MKKNYFEPTLNVEEIKVDDVILASGDGIDFGGNTSETDGSGTWDW